MVENKVRTGGFNVCTEAAQDITKAVQEFLAENEEATGERKLIQAEVSLLREEAEIDAGYEVHDGYPTMREITKRKAEKEAYTEKTEREARTVGKES